MKLIDGCLPALILAAVPLSCHMYEPKKVERQMPVPTDKQILNSDGVNISGMNIGNGAKSLNGTINKAGRDLMVLYEEFQAYLEQAQSPVNEIKAFKSRNTMVRVIAGSTIIDAAASGDPQKLAADLRSLGAKKVTVFGRIVSCQLPISAIPALNELASLQFARPAYAITNPGFVK